MKGTNEFRLNEATMIEIVQGWLDATIKGAVPKVESVKHLHTEHSFVIRMKERENSEGGRDE